MEHNADLVCVRGLPDGNPGVLGRAAVVLVPHPWGAGLRHRSVWDASGAARQAAKPDADRWVLLDEDAGKWADRGLAFRAQDARSQPLEHWLGPQAQLVLVALCTRAVVRSGARLIVLR